MTTKCSNRPWWRTLCLLTIILSAMLIPSFVIYGACCSGGIEGELDGTCVTGGGPGGATNCNKIGTGYVCYVHSRTEYCDGHDYSEAEESDTEDLSTTVVDNVEYVDTWYSSTKGEISGEGTKTRIRYDKFKITKHKEGYIEETFYMKCSKCDHEFNDVDKTPVDSSPWDDYEIVETTETAIRGEVAVYHQNTSGTFDESYVYITSSCKDENCLDCGWGAWYSDKDTGYSEGGKFADIPSDKKPSKTLSSHFGGWSLGDTYTHYASSTHTSSKNSDLMIGDKTDATVSSQTLSSGKRWHRYIYRKQYWIRLHPNKPTNNVSTSIVNKNPGHGFSIPSGANYYQRLCFVDENVYIPKTYNTFQMIGYASYNKWYTAPTDGSGYNDNKYHNFIQGCQTTCHSNPKLDKIHVWNLYARWFSEPGKIYLMPNSSSVGSGSDSCYGAYFIDPQNKTIADTYKWHEVPSTVKNEDVSK